MNIRKDFSIKINKTNELLICFAKVDFHEEDFFAVLSNIVYYFKANTLYIEYIDINEEILDIVLINEISPKTIFKLKKKPTLNFAEIGQNNKVYSGFLK
jgi:hypothetical protein